MQVVYIANLFSRLDKYFANMKFYAFANDFIKVPVPENSKFRYETTTF